MEPKKNCGCGKDPCITYGAELVTPKFNGHDKCLECGNIAVPVSEMDGGEIGLTDYYFSCADCDFSWYVSVKTDEHEDGERAYVSNEVGFIDEDGNIHQEPQEFNIMGQPNLVYEKYQEWDSLMEAESFGAESLPQTLEDCKKRLGIAEEVLSMSDAVQTYNKYLLQEMGIDRYADDELDSESFGANDDISLMMSIIDEIEANDIWNETINEMIRRGKAVRRPDGKVIFSDRVPQFDVIEDIAQYTTPEIKSAENSDFWMTFGRVDYNWITDPEDLELTDENFSIIDAHIRDEVRIQGPGLTDKQRDDIVNSLYSDCMFDENMKSSSRYREFNNDNVNELLKLIRKEYSEEEPWVTEYWDNDDEFTICINAANFESRVGAIMTAAAKASMSDKPLHIIFTVPIPVGKETLNSKRDKLFSMHLESLENRILNIHPAMLPKYGGKGMYGMHVHKAVKENNEQKTGITIHFVNEHYDEGNIIFQSSIQIAPTDSPEDIAQKVRADWIIGENVNGLINMGLDQILSQLEDNNYTTRVFNIPATTAGANHQRYRLWIVANSNGTHRSRDGISGRMEKTELFNDINFRPRGYEFTTWKGESRVYREHDGLSRGMDGIRRRRLKALGNSIVPQVVARIFEGIKVIYEQTNVRK